ncbi:uncharacterized protein, partial [Rutidosis leptorrhynchoides]|uniref:uncharacterized protein n=1 Tax=Rutidosis leptorrhynchoides TaxID=125765 RepID=UPI003A994C89
MASTLNESQLVGSLRAVVTRSKSKATPIVVNGYIVYTRLRKRHNRNNGVQLLDGVKKSSQEPITSAKASLVVKNVVTATKAIKRVVRKKKKLLDSVKKKKSVLKEGTVFDESQLVEVLVVEEFPSMKSEIEGVIVVECICVDGNSAFKEKSELRWSSGKDRVEGQINCVGKIPREFTRLKTESICLPGATETQAVSYLSEDATGDGASLANLKNNLELKMSKKIALNKKPTTVKELFETGLLEGVTVIYMGNKVSGLRGTIKDGGILCSCSYCKGCRVIPPSQFEIHACKQYRRASQYICFENGKSLLDVMRACRNSPLHTLEATLQSALSSSPEEKIFFCRRCKGSFPITCVGRVGPLCNSCVDSKKSEGSSNSKANSKSLSAKEVLDSRPFASASLGISVQNKTQWKITTKDQRLHKLVFEKDGLPDGTEVAYYARGKKLLEGYKKGCGILCCCCNCEVSPSQFEAHAGWASRRKPYAYIYTSSGLSLHELALSLSKDSMFSAMDNDDKCITCADGRNLLLCDGCPRAFHKDCASQSNIPHGDWYCQYCQSLFEMDKFAEHNANALAAGRVPGVDPMKQINERCTRIVKNVEAELTGCALCRAHDFSKSGFNPRTILLCDQCEREYHVGCLKTHKMADLKELPKGKWFCSNDCCRIHNSLQNMVAYGAEKLPDHLLNQVIQKHEEIDLDSSNGIDVSWRLISGKIPTPETRMLLGQAISIFHECFDPIIDVWSGRDLIPSMVYGRNLRDQEYGGMYCALLIVNSTVVSAGILRVFGRDFAELPLVATRKVNHGK